MSVVGFLSFLRLTSLDPPSWNCQSGETAPRVPTSILLLRASARPWHSEILSHGTLAYMQEDELGHVHSLAQRFGQAGAASWKAGLIHLAL